MNGNSAATADTIYTGGNIITVNDTQPTAEALAVKDGRILAVGTAEEVLKTQGNFTHLVDLGGKTLLPGFIDAHSHIAAYESMKWGYPDLTPPPVGDVRRITDIVARLKAFITKKKLPVGQLVVGMGYDDSLLEDQRHPTRADLDQVSTDHPVLAVHASGHLLAANSYALKMVNYNRETVDPNGGVIRRDATGEPNGVCEELAAFAFVALMKPKPMDDQVANLVEIQNYYASYGITTAQDGMSMDAEIALLREAATRNLLSLDIVSYPRWDMFNDVLRGERKLNIEYHPPMNCCDPLTADGPISVEPVIYDETKVQVGIYQNHLKFAGIKINADGSPQGKTAFLTQPYLHPPVGKPDTYRGYAVVAQEEVDRWFDHAYATDLQILMHCNGDATADMMIAAVRKAVAKHGMKDLRPVMIHAQMIRHDQVDAMAELGIIPSFFTAHTFFWGDWHINETVGRVRAFGMSPTGYALKKGIPFTNHSDAPVVPPDSMIITWTAVNRVSRSGVVVGSDERISPLEALKAITIYAAYQYFEENLKGSLEPGKLADLVILDQNPLEVDPMTIKDIRVQETIKEGKTIYSRS